MINVVTDLSERRRKKQWDFERSMLRALSIEAMRKDINERFFKSGIEESAGKMYVQDFCIDIGIDAYLLGSEFGKFGYDGETAEEAQARCNEGLNTYIEQTASQFFSWFTLTDAEQEQNWLDSKEFILNWWKLGFKEGEKKYRLRLH